MLFSFDTIESLPFFRKLPFSSPQKRILGVLLLLFSAIWLFSIILVIALRTQNNVDNATIQNQVTDTVPDSFYEYTSIEIEALLDKISALMEHEELYTAGTLLERLSYLPEPSFRQRSITAKLLVQQKQYSKAQKLITKLIQEYPNREDLALLYIQTFSASELLPPQWEKLVPDFTESPVILYQVAEIIAGSSPNEAIPLLEESLRWNPRSSQALFLLGKLFSNSDSPIRQETSLRYLKRAVEIEPNMPEYHAEYALLLHRKYENEIPRTDSFFVQAEAEYKKALDLSPQNSALLYNLADLYSFKKEEHKNAEDCLIQALQITPNLWQANFKLGLIYLENEKYAGAIKSFTKALEQSDNPVRVLHQLAVAYEKSGNSELAITTYEQILNIDPNDAISLYKMEFRE